MMTNTPRAADSFWAVTFLDCDDPDRSVTINHGTDLPAGTFVFTTGGQGLCATCAMIPVEDIACLVSSFVTCENCGESVS